MRGNIVIRFPNEQHLYVHTVQGGHDLPFMLYDALQELVAADAATLAGQIAARVMEHGEPTIGFARTLGDVDELHVDPVRGEVLRVTIDALREGGQTILHERVVARWAIADYLCATEQALAEPDAELAAA